MGKSLAETKHKENRDAETKVLFKKSNATIFTQSRTCSGASQLYSRSGILQIKKNLERSQNHNYYTDNGIVKRDLSIETDVCILRRYYRIKKNKMSPQNSSAKSKYSTLVDTEVETIEEFPDTSACGDNEVEKVKNSLPLNVASLMIDNLKDLLNQWIQKHLIDNKGTKQKFDAMLESIVQQLDARNNLACSSGSTYVLQREAVIQEVKNKKVATASLVCQHCRHKTRQSIRTETSSNVTPKSSSLTIPFEYKDIRVISTLSIPRSFHKRGTDDKKGQNSSCYKMRKMKHKNIILSIDKSNKIVKSSSFDLVAISTKSLTKRCTHCETSVKKRKRHIVFFPKPFYKSATDTTSTTKYENVRMNKKDNNKHQLDDMPSILKSLYANDPAIITNTGEHNEYEAKQDNSTMTENKFKIPVHNENKLSTEIVQNIGVKKLYKICEPDKDPKISTVAFDYIKNNIEFPNIKKTNSLDTTKHKKYKTYNANKKYSSKGKINKRKKYLGNSMSRNFRANKLQSVSNKQFRFQFKKTHSETQEKEFLKYCQNILHYFADFDVNKNIKLDVCINVFPMNANGTKDVCTDTSNAALGTYHHQVEPTLLYNVEPTEIKIETPIQKDELFQYHTEHDSSLTSFTPEIIPILDGAVSQTKYIFNVNSGDKMQVISKPNSCIERSTLTSELEIVQEISELRAVIKDLASAAEKFVSEHWKKESQKSNAGTSVSRNLSNNFTSSSKCEAVINLRNPSKAIQYSKEFSQNQKLQSGLKITKEPKKKDTFEYYNRLAKKSTSYRIIESESILKITDMTSKANEFNEYTKVMDNALTCSLPKSRSLFEMTSDNRNKRKLIALYCDGYQKNPQCQVCSECRNPSHTSFTAKPASKKWFCWPRSGKRDCPATSSESPPRSPSPPMTLATSPQKKPSCCCKSNNQSNSQSCDSCAVPILADDYGYSSTICFPDEEVEEEEHSTELMRNSGKEKRGMGFGEGCVYCMLLWIPVIIIAVLFYGYVIRDKVTFPESKKAVGRRFHPIDKNLHHRRNGSALVLKLSDLGF